jgi:hypothetical protein
MAASQTRPNNELDQFFALPGLSIHPRLVMALDGPDKVGRTHYALMTTPTPVRVISNDTGTEVVAQKARAMGRDVKVMYIDMPDPNPKIVTAKDVDPEDLTQWRNEWVRAVSAFEAIGRDRTVKTLVVDTASKLWNLCLLANFGKMKKIPQHLRETPNSEFYKMLWDLYKSREDLNIILIHLVKKKYVPSSKPGVDAEWDGTYERAGWRDIGAYCDLSVVAGWDGTKNPYTQQANGYYTEIDGTRATRYGSHLSGRRWYGPQNTFWNLGMEVFPETEMTPEVWGQ